MNSGGGAPTSLHAHAGRALAAAVGVAAGALFLLHAAAGRSGFDEEWLLRGADALGLGPALASSRGEMRRPLFWAAVRALGTPQALHAAAAVVHGATAALVALLAARLAAVRGGRRPAVVGALFAAAWAMSPARVEAVADATALRAPLGTAFAAIAALLFTHAQTAARRPHATVLAASGACALALLADPYLFPLPVALAALRAWLRRDDPDPRPGARGSLVPMWLLAATALVATAACREPGGDAPFTAAIAGMGAALVRPFRAAVWPIGLHPAYDPPEGFPAEVPATLVIDGVTAVAAIAAAVVGLRRRAGFGAALAAHLALAAGPVLLARNPVGADSDGYAAAVPLFLGAAVAASTLGAVARTIATAAAGLLAAACGFATSSALGAWTDETTLARSVDAADPGNERARVALGDAARRAGGASADLRPWYEAALERSDHRPLAHARLGAALLESGDTAGARVHLERAAAIAPWLAAARFDLAALDLREGRADTARGHAEAAVRLDATSVEAWRLLGRIRDAAGDRRGAADAVAAAAALAPGDASVAEELRRLAK